MTFTQHMIPHHRQALEMAELVQSRTTRPELVKLAERAGIGAAEPSVVHEPALEIAW